MKAITQTQTAKNKAEFTLSGLTYSDLQHIYDGLTVSFQLSEWLKEEAPNLLIQNQKEAEQLAQTIHQMIKANRNEEH